MKRFPNDGRPLKPKIAGKTHSFSSFLYGVVVPTVGNGIANRGGTVVVFPQKIIFWLRCRVYQGRSPYPEKVRLYRGKGLPRYPNTKLFKGQGLLSSVCPGESGPVKRGLL